MATKKRLARTSAPLRSASPGARRSHSLSPEGYRRARNFERDRGAAFSIPYDFTKDAQAAGRIASAKAFTIILASRNQQPRAPADAASIRDLHNLADAIVPILEEARCRRKRDLHITARSRAIAALLIEARDFQHKERGRPVSDMNAKIVALRLARDRAQRAWDKLDLDRAGSMTAHRRLADLIFARQRLKATIDDLNYRRTGLPKGPSKHRVPAARAGTAHVIHELYYDFGLPDPTTAALLKAAGLAILTPRNIKRIRRPNYRRS